MHLANQKARLYNALVKKKEIDPMEKSFKEFFFDSYENYLTVDEVIAFIKQPFTDSEPEEPETENVE